MNETMNTRITLFTQYKCLDLHFYGKIKNKKSKERTSILQKEELYSFYSLSFHEERVENIKRVENIFFLIFFYFNFNSGSFKTVRNCLLIFYFVGSDRVSPLGHLINPTPTDIKINKTHLSCN